LRAERAIEARRLSALRAPRFNLPLEVLGLETELASKYRSARSRSVTGIKRRSYEILHEGCQIEAVVDEGVEGCTSGWR
jgi:hypothetical protein